MIVQTILVKTLMAVCEMQIEDIQNSIAEPECDVEHNLTTHSAPPSHVPIHHLPWHVFSLQQGENFLVTNAKELTEVSVEWEYLIHCFLLIVWFTNWAMSWENLFMPYANNKGADQPAHPHSLISAFVFTA